MPLAAGDNLGPYQILAPLGKGGMGEVCRAFDPRLKREVAIKTSTEKFNERFEREARAIAALNHPNICTLYDIGPDYLVMELVEGSSPKGPMPLEEALKVAGQIAAALETAHEKGIVHRDLKPDNVKLTTGGVVKVLDFGLAKVVREEASDRSTLTTGVTAQGVVIGTPAYMAPEQIEGKEVDRRADVWAFGVLLHELLTGHRPFKGDSVQAVMASVLAREPDLTKVPHKVRRLLRACLQKQPSDRLSSIGDWRLLLDEGPVVRVSHSRLPWAVAALCLVGALGLLFFLAPVRPSPSEVSRFQISAPDGSTFGLYARISPDGRKIAFTALGKDGRTTLWVRDLSSEYPRQIAGTEISSTFGGPSWSHDSKSIAYADGKRLRRVDASGTTPPQTLTEIPYRVASSAWSSKGIIVFGTLDPAPIFMVPETGGTATPVINAAADAQGLPSFLSDETHFLYFGGDGDTRGIFIGSVDLKPEQQSKEPLLATPYGATYVPPMNSSAAYVLFVGPDRVLRAQAFDEASFKLTGPAVPIVEGIGSVNSVSFHSASKNGALTYRRNDTNQQRLTWLDRQGNRVGTLAEAGAIGNGFRISPDGRRVAAEVIENGNSDIWVFGINDHTVTRLTFGPTAEDWPVWSLDGKSVAYRSASDIRRKAVDGTGSEELLVQSDAVKYPDDWSSDGAFLIFQEGGLGGYDIRLLSTSKGAVAPWLVTNNDEENERISPDGHWVSYESNETGRYEIFVREFTGPSATGIPSGGKWQVSRNGARYAKWRGDSRELFYLAENGDLMSVEVNNGGAFVSGTPKRLFTLPTGSRYEILPDGSRILARLPDESFLSAPITIVLNWQRLLTR